MVLATFLEPSRPGARAPVLAEALDCSLTKPGLDGWARKSSGTSQPKKPPVLIGRDAVPTYEMSTSGFEELAAPVALDAIAVARQNTERPVQHFVPHGLGLAVRCCRQLP